MLIEQIFDLRGSGPPGRACTPTTGCFHDKTIISKDSLRVDLYLLLALQKAMYLTSLTWAKSLTKFNSKMQDLNVFWT